MPYQVFCHLLFFVQGSQSSEWCWWCARFFNDDHKFGRDINNKFNLCPNSGLSECVRSLCLESNRTKYQLDLYYIFSDFVIDYRNENYGCSFFEVCDQLFNSIFLSANYFEGSFLVRKLGLQILRLNIVLLMTVIFAILVFVKNLKKEVVGYSKKPEYYCLFSITCQHSCDCLRNCL